MVELQDVSFSYTKEVGTLTHVDLTIRPGECVLLCGASGCGKTTITKLVNGLIPAFTSWPGRGGLFSRTPKVSFSTWIPTVSWPLAWKIRV